MHQLTSQYTSVSTHAGRFVAATSGQQSAQLFLSSTEVCTESESQLLLSERNFVTYQWKRGDFRTILRIARKSTRNRGLHNG
jgi:hypothetical protein